LAYWSTDPLYRRWHHHQLTFGLTYAWSEHFVLPLSHDEVVHLKGSLLTKMPGTEDERFEHLRSLYAWMWAHPGQQLLFMGGELAVPREWAHDRSLDWDVLHDPRHRGVQDLVAELHALEAAHPALHEGDADPAGFAWLDADDADHSTFAFERRDPGGTDVVVCLANLAGIGRHGYRVGVSQPGRWGAALSTDDERFGGHGGWRGATVEAEDVPWHGRAHSVVVTLPARSVTWLVPVG
jgi:1,4-alpha-glucan branching enzyme